MQLNNLPDDILAYVFKWATTSIRHHQSVFEENLTLLKVCHKWRELAKPSVYNYVFAIGDTKRPTPQHMGQIGMPQEEDLDNAKIISNLSLIGLTGSFQYVQCIDLTIYHKKSPLPILAEILDMFDEIAKVWSSSKSLNLEFPLLTINGSYDIQPFIQNIEHTAAWLARLFPRIAHAELKGSSSDVIANLLCTKLTNHYSNQLQSLDSGFYIDPDQTNRLLCLKSLTMTTRNTNNTLLPSVCGSTLVEFKLYSNDENLDWSLFKDEQDKEAVVFNNLTYLDLQLGVAASVAQGNNANLKLHFPRLQHLYLVNHAQNCSFLSTSILPSHLDTLSIVGPLNIFNTLSAHKLAHIGEFNANVCIDDHHDAQAICQPINKLLSCADGNVSELTITGKSLILNVAELRFKNLYSLKLMVLPDISDLVDIIANGQMKIIEIAQLKADNAPPEMGSSDIDNIVAANIIPLNQSLEQLTFRFNPRIYGTDCIVNAMKHLLARLPMLKCVYARQIPNKPISEFIDKYKTALPHLASVEFNGCP